MNITIADQDLIDQYESIGTIFFKDMFLMSYREALVTDESRLSELAPLTVDDNDQIHWHYETMREFYDVCDSVLIPRVKEFYGIELKNTAILLTDIFAMLDEKFIVEVDKFVPRTLIQH
jgi:hypothetical protein